jgi:uncharacterized phage protein (TIGR02216 family)
MAAGLGILRLSPATLWSMTPREFAAAVGWLVPETAPPSRSDLSRLMTRFPDSRTTP